MAINQSTNQSMKTH